MVHLHQECQIQMRRLTFIHSFWIFLSRLFKSTTTQRCPRHSTNTVSEFHAEAPQATASEELAQGSYVADRAGFKPTTLRSTGIDSTNELPRPDSIDNSFFNSLHYCSVQMKQFVIFLWMVIGSACLDLQRIEDGEHYLKSNNSGRKAASPAANETVNITVQEPFPLPPNPPTKVQTKLNLPRNHRQSWRQ